MPQNTAVDRTRKHGSEPSDGPTRRAALVGGVAIGLTAALAGGPLWGARSARAATPRTFYVDPKGGDDTAAGTPSWRSWASTARANAALAAGEIGTGDTLLLRRGRRHFGVLRPGAVGGLTIGSWGDEPESPEVTAYKYVQSEACWVRVGDDLWAVDISGAAHGRTHHGHVSAWSTEVGFIKVDGTIHGDRKGSVSSLHAAWQFVSSGATVTVRNPENPSRGGRRVWLAVAEPILEGRSGVVVTDLVLRGTGRNAVQTSSAVPTRGFELRDCTVGEAGGGFASDGVSRFGNGVQVWSGAEDVLVQSTTITDCWDTATTIQGPVQLGDVGWRNVVFEGNDLDRNMQGFEYWSTGARSGAPGTACTFRGNRSSAAGSSWSRTLRPDRAGKGSHLLFYGDSAVIEVRIEGNTFSGASDSYLYANRAIPERLRSDRNVIELTQETRLQWQTADRIGDAAAWSERTGLERSSTFRTIA